MVLVVDDEPAIRRLLLTVLSEGDWDTVTMPDAETALRLIDVRTPDAMVVDICLPGMDGVEFARRVRSAVGCIPLAFISAWEEPPAEAMSPAAPVAYFRKPFDVEALAGWVTDVMSDRRRLRP